MIEDYDYKVVASFDGETVKATIHRNEYDLNIIPKDLFEDAAFKVQPYTFDDFSKGVFEKTLTLSELTGNNNERNWPISISIYIYEIRRW